MKSRILNIGGAFFSLCAIVAFTNSCASNTPAGEKNTATKAPVAKAPPKKVQPPGIPDSEISLRKDSVFVTAKALPAPQYSDKDPGENKRLPRSFDIAPPMIPHAANYKLGQTIAKNECLECHLDGDDGAPKLTQSHRVEMVMKAFDRKASKAGQIYAVVGQKEVKGVSAWRHNCTACHAPQGMNLKPLVEIMLPQ